MVWNLKPGLGNMWANINYPGSYNKQHIHPNSQWSGVYYVKVPKNSGSLFLEDPRPGPNIILPRSLPGRFTQSLMARGDLSCD